MELIFDSYSELLKNWMENFFPAHIYLRIQCGRRWLFFTSEEKKMMQSGTLFFTFILLPWILSAVTQPKPAGPEVKRHVVV